jgi:flavin-dependent dehydrogenase
MVKRSELDSELLKSARRAGAEVITGKAVVDVDDRGPVLESGKRIAARFVVGADGAGSLVRRRLTGKPMRAPGIGMQAFVDNPPPQEHGLQIHFGMVPWGYGWVFPRAGETCIGLGGTGRRFQSRMLAGSFEALCRMMEVEAPPRPRGALIPSRNLHGSLGKGNIFLAGDAAGLVDQVTGEGIGNAVESGLLVAEAILRGGDRRWLRKAARRGCLGSVLQSRLFAGLLYHERLQPRAMRRMGEDDKFMAGFWRLLAGETTYCRMILGYLKS